MLICVEIKFCRQKFGRSFLKSFVQGFRAGVECQWLPGLQPVFFNVLSRVGKLLVSRKKELELEPREQAAAGLGTA